ncbi:MAG: hypothetical protein K6E12_09480 [Saccharofermentans sp.]|nr:hypothetical protein [Saccharofermentans sp.]
MIYGALPDFLENNRQIGFIMLGFAAVAFVIIVIVLNIANARDRQRDKLDEKLEKRKKGEQIIHNVEAREHRPEEKKINQVKRETRDPKKKAEEEAAEKNMLLGGKSEAQLAKKDATQVFGALGVNSRKVKQMDKEREQIIINGYLQKSNTAPIRPVYSNTLAARQQQRKELESDTYGAEAETPALVMDSAAPSKVKITNSPFKNKKVKPTELKPPTAARVDGPQVPEEPDTTYGSAMRPVVGSEVSNAEVDFVAEVQEEKPDIMKTGEEAILPAAEQPVEGFAPSSDLPENGDA